MNAKHAMGSATAMLVALLMSVTSATVTAQNAKPKGEKMPPHQEGMKGMNGVVGDAHRVLAMAYRGNLATFAQALQGHVNRSKSVNLDLARPAVAEMQRSLGQMREHFQEHVRMMGDRSDPPLSRTMQHMETGMTAISEHLSALELEVNDGTPDYRKVSEHTRAMLNVSSSMSSMPAKARPGQVK